MGAVAPRFAFVSAYRCMEPDVYECSGVVGRLFALDPRSGKTRWSIGGAQGSVRAGPVWYADAVANGSVYVSGVRGRGISLAALAVKTGRVRWSSSIPGRYGSIAAVADGWVIAASSGAGAVPPGSKVWAFHP
jgi:outer membrane protein assembly factor BamB